MVIPGGDPTRGPGRRRICRGRSGRTSRAALAPGSGLFALPLEGGLAERRRERPAGLRWQRPWGQAAGRGEPRGRLRMTATWSPLAGWLGEGIAYYGDERGEAKRARREPRAAGTCQWQQISAGRGSRPRRGLPALRGLGPPLGPGWAAAGLPQDFGLGPPSAPGACHETQSGARSEGGWGGGAARCWRAPSRRSGTWTGAGPSTCSSAPPRREGPARPSPAQALHACQARPPFA